jgi:hypothetical protein
MLSRITRGMICLALAVMLSSLLAGCKRDKGDPERISRDFMVAVWTGDAARVEVLTCKEWREVTTGWAQQGDPTLTIDTDHLTFKVLGETDKQIDLQMAGVYTFKWPSGREEVRNLDEMGTTQFTLIDENGWKVCGISVPE